jgi:hypothetical protein
MRLPTSMAVRFGAVVAAAAIAVTGASAVASAATVGQASVAPAAHQVHKIPTKLAIWTTAPKVNPHHSLAIIKGHLTAGRFNLRHVRVFLMRKGAGGHWFRAQVKLTDRYGRVFFWVHVGKSPVSFRLVFLGTRNLARSVSAEVTIARPAA